MKRSQLVHASRRVIPLAIFLLLALAAAAAPPAGYYDGTDGLINETLRARLRQIITNGHTLRSFSSSSSAIKDTIDKESDGRVMDIYYNTYFASGETISIEHTWPRSYGADVTANGEGDVHHLRPTRADVNSARGNWPFGWVPDPTRTYGEGKVSSITDRFEPPDAWKGDVARGMFYFAVRFGYPMCDDGESIPNPGMGYEDILRQWHELDPVSDAERERNDRVYSYQGNRNPFIDHPEFVSRIATFGIHTTPEMAVSVAPLIVYTNSDPQIEATVISANGIAPATAIGYYRVKGSGTAYSSVALALAQGTLTNGLLRSQSTLPRRAAGVVVEFYAEAQDTLGQTVRSPSAGTFTYTVAEGAEPTQTITPTPSPTASISPTPSATPTASLTPTASPTPSPTPLFTELDLGGWVVRQTDSTQNYTLPAGTRARSAGFVIIARDAAQAAFETYWGVTLGANVTFVNSGGAMPVINGDETYTLENATGTVIEGPTRAIKSGGGESLRRVDFALAANNAAAWTASGAAPGQTTPGSLDAPARQSGQIQFSEIADSSGTGNFIYEYLEFYYDAEAPPEPTPTPSPTVPPSPSPSPTASPTATSQPTPTASPTPAGTGRSAWVLY